MPRGDRTGPLGEGPMTGRQLGYGAGYDSPGYTRAAGGRLGRGFWDRGAGFGPGFGRGFFRRGWGRRLDPGYFWRHSEQVPPEYEGRETDIDALRSEVRNLKDSLSTILEQIKSFSKTKEEK